MTKLYYSPRACSLAPHIVLEELGIPYELKQVRVSAGEHLTPEYLKINPRARVPAMETEGEILTEVGAILTYLADRHPEHGLVPEPGTLLRGRCHEWLSFLGSSVHIGYAQLWRPERFTDDAAAKKTVTAAGREAITRFTREIDGLLAGREYALGERYSIVDPYLLVFYLWAVAERVPLEGLDHYTALARRVLAREAVRRALDQEHVPV